MFVEVDAARWTVGRDARKNRWLWRVCPRKYSDSGVLVALPVVSFGFGDWLLLLLKAGFQIFEPRCRKETSSRSNEQGRQAEYDRLTALPRWARTLGKNARCKNDTAATSDRNESRLLS